MAFLAMSRMPEPPHYLCPISTNHKLIKINNAKTPQFIIYIHALFINHLLWFDKILKTKLIKVEKTSVEITSH